MDNCRRLEQWCLWAWEAARLAQSNWDFWRRTAMEAEVREAALIAALREATRERDEGRRNVASSAVDPESKSIRVGQLLAALADPQPAEEHVIGPSGWCSTCGAYRCVPAPAATGNPAAVPVGHAMCLGCDREYVGHRPAVGEACPGCGGQDWLFVGPAAGKAATGERHEFVGPGHYVKPRNFGCVECGQYADAAVHQTTTEDSE